MIYQLFKIIILMFLFLNISCQKYVQLSRIEPTKDFINKNIKVITKGKQTFKFIKYKITNKMIIGIDKQKTVHEISIDEIYNVILISKHNKFETLIFISSIAISILFIFFLYTYSPFQNG